MNIFRGLNNKVDPTSPAWEPGFASACDNSRIDDNMSWNQGPSLGSHSETLTKVGTELSGQHMRTGYYLGTRYIFTGIGNADTLATAPNGYTYWVDNSASSYAKAYNGTIITANGVAAPTTLSSITTSGTGTRMEEGIYYYTCTKYNTARDCEGLCSYIYEHYVAKRYENDSRIADVPVLPGVSGVTGEVTRWYRSMRIPIAKGDTRQLGTHAVPTEFYFIGEAVNSTAFSDYAHDSEIKDPTNIYTGRGGRPPTNNDCIATFDDRMFYFQGTNIYWSSAGRPEEVPQVYTQTIKYSWSEGVWTAGTYKDKLTAGAVVTETLNLTYPILDTGHQGEAMMECTYLASQNAIVAREHNGKLWFWTETSTFYIERTDNVEGYRYVKVVEGIGAANPNVLDISPYGLFGADKEGIWLLTDSIKRVGFERIDLSSLNAVFTTAANVASSFGVWVDSLKEYWWSVNNYQLAYRVDIDAFVGPYDLSITGGCSYTDGVTNSAFLTGDKAPILTERQGAQTLKFWFGDPYAVKDNLKVEVIYLSNNTTVTASVKMNSIASETGASTSNSYSHTSANLVGMIEPKISGRFFEVALAYPSSGVDKIAPVAAINFRYDKVPFGERNRR